MYQSGDQMTKRQNSKNQKDKKKYTYWFQCSLEILYKLPNMIGRILSIFSSIKLRIYSLFQKYNALSAT